MPAWSGGKGSSRRPMSVDQEKYSDNWDRIFGKKKTEPELNEEYDRFEELMAEEEEDKDER